jgi:flagellar motor switch protein FliG
MGAKDVQRVGGAMSNMRDVSRTEVQNVVTIFNESIAGHGLSSGGDEFIRKVLVTALGEEKAAAIIDRIFLGQSGKGLEAVKWMDPRAVAELIRQEHPQIIAIVLAYLDADQAAKTLAVFPDWLRTEVMIRIATLDGIQPTALTELDEMMELRFSGGTTAKTALLGGPKAAANILNFLEGSISSPLLETITQGNEQLAARIQDLMFVFGNLLEVDDRGMQELLRNVASDRLLLALKGADDRLKEKIFKNMSQRAADMLKDDMEARGPVKLSAVEAAQKEILASARKMIESGTLLLGGQGEEYV